MAKPQVDPYENFTAKIARRCVAVSHHLCGTIITILGNRHNFDKTASLLGRKTTLVLFFGLMERKKMGDGIT